MYRARAGVIKRNTYYNNQVLQLKPKTELKIEGQSIYARRTRAKQCYPY
jgi:hypothetical protein